MSPQHTQSNAEIINPVQRIAVGKRGTNPVSAYVIASGIASTVEVTTMDKAINVILRGTAHRPELHSPVLLPQEWPRWCYMLFPLQLHSRLRTH